MGSSTGSRQHGVGQDLSISLEMRDIHSLKMAAILGYRNVAVLGSTERVGWMAAVSEPSGLSRTPRSYTVALCFSAPGKAAEVLLCCLHEETKLAAGVVVVVPSELKVLTTALDLAGNTYPGVPTQVVLTTIVEDSTELFDLMAQRKVGWSWWTGDKASGQQSLLELVKVWLHRPELVPGQIPKIMP